MKDMKFDADKLHRAFEKANPNRKAVDKNGNYTKEYVQIIEMLAHETLVRRRIDGLFNG